MYIICENTQTGPFWPLILKWVGPQTPNSIPTFLLCQETLCESFKLIICYYVEDIIHLSCVIFTDEHNYAQLTETEDVICDMTPDHSYTLSPPSEVPQTPINSTVNYTWLACSP
jgi:hypothetical protein